LENEPSNKFWRISSLIHLELSIVSKGGIWTSDKILDEVDKVLKKESNWNRVEVGEKVLQRLLFGAKTFRNSKFVVLLKLGKVHEFLATTNDLFQYPDNPDKFLQTNLSQIPTDDLIKVYKSLVKWHSKEISSCKTNLEKVFHQGQNARSPKSRSTVASFIRPHQWKIPLK